MSLTTVSLENNDVVAKKMRLEIIFQKNKNGRKTTDAIFDSKIEAGDKKALF